MKKSLFIPLFSFVFLLFPFFSFANGPAPLPLIVTKGGPVRTYRYLLKQQTQIFVLSSIQQENGFNGSIKPFLGPPSIPQSVLEAANNPQMPFNTPYLMTNSILNSLAYPQRNGTAKAVENLSLPSSVQRELTNIATTITLIHWNERLIDAKTLEFAKENEISDLIQLQRYRQGLLYEYPVNKEIVIHVKITNRSFLPLDFSPFSSHIFLINSSTGSRVNLIHYDPALNQVVQEGETIEGNLYFPKFSKNSTLKGMLKNINGQNDTFTFH
ncbi:MAG: hypothetical protein M1421_02595 [Candidatus Eremiobacteraeota bacterium]|nr:hypothetical protein [Candidatus Eremiobacteraeota bacterium]